MVDVESIATISFHEDRINLSRLYLSEQVLGSVSDALVSQYHSFTNKITEYKPFDIAYKLDSEQAFVIKDYPMPAQYERIYSADALENYIIRDEELSNLKGFMAHANIDGERMLLFQKFWANQIVRVGMPFILSGGQFRIVDHNSLAFGKKLEAIFYDKSKSLLFRSFQNVNSFLPLDFYFTEISDRGINELFEQNSILSHKNLNKVIKNLDKTTRRSFSILKHRTILGSITIEQIKNKAEEVSWLSETFDIEIIVDNGQLVFPEEKQEVKKLLYLLNDRIFIGGLDGELYYTNSNVRLT